MRKWLPTELEEIPCDFCGSMEVVREFIRADGMRVVECAFCGLAFLNPRPRPEFISMLYDKDYFTGESADRGEGGLRLNPDSLSCKSIEHKEDIPRAIQIVNDKFGGFNGKKVLEIGCATGDLLIQLNKQGAITKGVEISEFASEIARKRGLDVITGTVENVSDEYNDTFDIVIALEVIEHVLSPSQFIFHASKLLKPKGFLFISTPNYFCAQRFKYEWFGFKSSFEHIYFFNLKTIRALARRNNLFIDYWETSSFPGGDVSSLNLFKRQIFKFQYMKFLIEEISAKEALKIYFNKLYYKYGLGHTLCTILKQII